MSFDPYKVIKIAKKQVGYLEKATNSNLDDKTANPGDGNYTKFARDLDKLGFYNSRKNGYAWCDVFVDWCFVKAYGVEAACKLTNQKRGSSNCGAGCRYSRIYYKQMGRLFKSPKIGDQIFFYPADKIGGDTIQHTGLVYNVDNKYVYTIEGNTREPFYAPGGVYMKKYYRTDPILAGFGRPKWDEGSTLKDFPKGTKVVSVIAATNIREGDATKYNIVSKVKKGEVFEWIATSNNGEWYAIRMAERICWINSKSTKLQIGGQ